MTLYVDDSREPSLGAAGTEMWSRLAADSADELEAFLLDAGIPLTDIQARRSTLEHVLVPEGLRDALVDAGSALAITEAQFGALVIAKAQAIAASRAA